MVAVLLNFAAYINGTHTICFTECGCEVLRNGSGFGGVKQLLVEKNASVLHSDTLVLLSKKITSSWNKNISGWKDVTDKC